MDAEHEFTMGGKQYLLTCGQFQERLRGIKPEPINKHFVEICGIRYPVKQALAVGLPVQGDRSDFTSQEAVRILHQLGYQPDIATASLEQVQEFILGGKRYHLTRRSFEDRLKGVKPERITKHTVDVAGHVYSVKQAVGVGLDLPRLHFTTIDAIRILRKLGYTPREG